MFITFEGIDGSGKTTQIGLLSKFFHDKNKPTLITAEPAKYSAMSHAIYDIIKQSEESTPICDLLLVYALRSLHISNIVKPALARGEMVICDRYIDSSIAYYSRDFDKYNHAVETVLALHNIAGENLIPNLTFLLDLPAEVASKRIVERKGIDKFDNMQIDQMEQIRQVFLKNAVSEIANKRTYVIDGTQTEEVIFSDIIKIINNIFD